MFDGGVDWEGTLWRANGPNLFTFLPPVLRAYPRYLAGSAAARQEIIDAGFPQESEFLWDYHYRVYWDLAQRTFREEFDPAFDGGLEAGIPFCASGTPACDADYDYASRPREVRTAADRMVRTAGSGHLHRYHRIVGGTHADGLADAHPGRIEPLGPHFRTAFDALAESIGVPPAD